MSLQDTITLAALQNAIKFKGTANPKALTGAIIREHPECKLDMGSLMKEIARITAEINSLSLEEQQEKLLSLDPDHEAKQQAQKEARKAKANELPELPNATMGNVITRIPPGPSKYNHLGHAMSFLINYLYAQKYQGKVIFRFEDTNPDADAQEYVDAMKQDCFEYLGIQADSIIFASDDMEKFYAYVETLLEQGHAYLSDDTSEEIATQRRAFEASKDRDKTIEENRTLWNALKEGSNTTHAVRLKIDHAHKNAVMRDPVIFRSNTNEHYRQGRKYNAWPMFDFENPVEEGLTGVTHVLRSNEFDQRIELHNYIAKLLDFPEVTYKHYGRYNVIGSTTKGREIRELIESGNYLGWDDPRLVTLQALKRRGIVKEAYYTLAKQIGLSKTQTNLDFGVIAAVNRSLLDENAKRFFGVKQPVEIMVRGIPPDKKTFDLAYHPHGEKGERKLNVVDTYYVEEEDHIACNVGEIIRLMDAMNIKKVGETEYEFLSFEHDKSLNAKLIHYVPKDGKEVPGEILLPDLRKQTIICEANAASLEVDDVIQFERYAFVRVDEKSEGTLKFWFTHE